MDDPASSFFLLFQNTPPANFASLTEILFDFAIIFVIIGLNAFFVASEFSLVSARRPRIQTFADEGNRGAAAVLRLLDNPTRFISAVQLGVTLASLALGWLGEQSLSRMLEPIAAR